MNGVNPEGGWVPKLAQLYPEHNFYVYACAGYGYMLMQHGIRDAYLKGCDMVLIQQTTPREIIPLCDSHVHGAFKEGPDGKKSIQNEFAFRQIQLRTPNVLRLFPYGHAVHVKHSFADPKINRSQWFEKRFSLDERLDMYVPMRMYSANQKCCSYNCSTDKWFTERKMMQENDLWHEIGHPDDIEVDEAHNVLGINAPNMPYKREVAKNVTSYGSHLLAYILCKGQKEFTVYLNERFQQMYISQLRIKPMLKKIFKHVFQFPVVCHRVASADFSPDVTKMFEKEWGTLFDWDISVACKLIEEESARSNVSFTVASRIFQDIWSSNLGHLSDDMYVSMLQNYLLKNKNFANVLDS